MKIFHKDGRKIFSMRLDSLGSLQYLVVLPSLMTQTQIERNSSIYHEHSS